MPGYRPGTPPPPQCNPGRAFTFWLVLGAVCVIYLTVANL